MACSPLPSGSGGPNPVVAERSIRPHGVERAEQRRKRPAHPIGVELLEDVAVHPLGDGVRGAVRLADLQHLWDREVGRRVDREPAVLLEVPGVLREPDHQVAPVVPEEVGTRPGALPGRGDDVAHARPPNRVFRNAAAAA